MGEYLDAHAPQWVDFTEPCSPQVAQDFFDKIHSVEPKEKLSDSIFEDASENLQSTSQEYVSCPDTLTKMQEDLSIIKNTSVKMISPNRNKDVVVTVTTYDQVLSDAMRTLEFCQKSSKNRDMSNKINQESNVLKTPGVPKVTKSSRSIGFHSVPNKRAQSSQNSVSKSTKIDKDNKTANMRRTLANHHLFKQDACVKNNASKISNVCSLEDAENKGEEKPSEDSDGLKENNKELNQENNEHKKENDDKFKNDSGDHNEEDNKEQVDLEEPMNDTKNKEEHNQDDVDSAVEKTKQRQSNKHASVLTWQNHRRSMYKRGTSTTNNKQYVSLAEAVSRFQNMTPIRFRTRSTKENNTLASINLPTLMQNRLRTTVPVSPALISKNRTRAVTVLSKEEREKLELEEMKKHQIKAKPIPPSVLRGPRIIPKDAKKSTDTCSATQSKSNETVCGTNLLQDKNSSPVRHDKTSSGLKNTVPKITVTNTEGIIVQHQTIPFFGVPKQDSVTKSVTRVQPFSFEARNKNLQMKKEQRLKSLQEANKAKIEFHARPVPNFSRTSTPLVKQQQQNVKKPVLPCPFGFEERNKQLSKKKEQLVKQVLEEDKRSRIFRANPAPFFKPVMVRGRSKDRLFTQDKKVTNEHEDQENREPNVDSSKTGNKNAQKTKATCIIDKQKASLKEIHPPELNTDKRLMERREFEERLKRKEMEEEAKRQEENQKRLEQEKYMKAELRKLTVMKARPMPKYKPPVIAKATKQLTEPQSPAFASKLRSKQTETQSH